MKTHELIAVAALVLFAAMLMTSQLAAAPSIQVPVTGHTSNTTIDFGPARIWVDEEGIQHVRGAVYTDDFTGEAGGVPMYGVSVGEFNWDVDVATGNGTGHGETFYQSTWGSIKAIYR